MGITKRTVVDQREISAAGVIQIRFRKEIVENGIVLSSQFHRTSIQPGDDLDEQMQNVNEHLATMGCEAVSEDDIESIRRIVTVEHTAERIAAFRAAISPR